MRDAGCGMRYAVSWAIAALSCAAPRTCKSDKKKYIYNIKKQAEQNF